MKKKLWIILLGLPSGGKGTLARLLRSIFKKKGDIAIEFSSSILRKEAPETVKWMDAGELVPDDIVIPIVIDALKKANEDILILDGFPRKITQVELFLEVAKDKDAQVVILNLNTPKEVAIQRAENRLVCSNCGDTWSKTGKMTPMEPGKCDTCGGALIRRRDDELIEKRIEIHEKYVIPAADLLKQSGVPSITIDYERTEKEYIAECINLLIS